MNFILLLTLLRWGQTDETTPTHGGVATDKFESRAKLMKNFPNHCIASRQVPSTRGLGLKCAGLKMGISKVSSMLTGQILITTLIYGVLARIPLWHLPIKERPSHWRVSRFLPRNLGIFPTPIQNKVATSVE